MIGSGSSARDACAPGGFPTLDTDLRDGGAVTKKRVCIATADLLGLVGNGGTGAACAHFARFLAGQGHEVVIAYVDGNASNVGLREEARAFCAGFGVGFNTIVSSPGSDTVLARVAAPAWALLDWLRGRERAFDVVHVSEWHGLGYGALLAKSLGVAFGETHFVVKGSSPTLWNVEGNRRLLSTERELGWVFMERRSIELADTVICGSAHLLGWMRDAGYALPSRSFVWPNVFGESLEVWSRWHAQAGPFEASAQRYARRVKAAGEETPLVTVCIVHHERPGLVRMAVESVVGQDYPSLEAVLVDDGSESAGALAALDGLEAEFAGRGWRVIRQENRYLGAARNAAAAAARGEWLLFLDDDNVLFPDAVSRLVRAARFSGAECVPAASIRFFGDGDPRTDARSHGTPIRFLGAARGWSRFRNVVGDACALVRRDVFEAVGGFTEEYRVGLEDLSFYNRLMRAGHRLEPLPEPAYYYRFGTTSMKSRNRSAEAAQFRVLAPHIEGLSADERAYAAFALARIHAPVERFGRLAPPPGRKGPRAAAGRRRWWVRGALFRAREALIALVAPGRWRARP